MPYEEFIKGHTDRPPSEGDIFKFRMMQRGQASKVDAFLDVLVSNDAHSFMEMELSAEFY